MSVNLFRRVRSGMLLAGLALFAFDAVVLAQAPQAIPWQADYQRALQLGRQTGRPVLIHFSATWCVPCQRMDREVFVAPDIRARLAQQFVAVRIDYDRDPAVARRFGVQTLPTDVILDPVNGQLVARNNGPMGAAAYNQFLQRQTERYQQIFAARKPAAPPAAVANSPQPPPTQQSAARPAAQPVWYASYAEALAAAERLERPLLVHFYGETCPPCRQMERDVFPASDVQRMLSERYAAVKIDANREQQIAQQFGVDALPTDIIIEPFNGRLLSENNGYLDRNGYLSMLARMDARFTQLAKAQVASRAVTPAETTEPERPASPAEPLQPQVRMGEARPLVALDGFSPVALSKGRRWAQGKSEFAWQYQGLVYYLESREELEAFRASPEAYAPQYQGCDPVLLAELDRAVAGDPRYAAFYDDRLYLFTTAEHRQKFRDNPAKYMRLKQVVKPSRIEGLRYRLGELLERDVRQVLLGEGPAR